VTAAPLPTTHDLRERVDTAQVLSRFHYLERALALACGGWIPAVPRIEQKAALARTAWQCALTADAVRTRVFELRYPSRLLEAGADVPLIGVYETAINAPDAPAFLAGLSQVLCPALLVHYREVLASTDLLDDGPTVRILEAAARDKEEQIEALAVSESSEWPERLRAALVALEPPPGRPFRLAEEPARDDRYFISSFYWPDTVDPDYPYGEGLALQLRSAVSHLNEVWAVETAGAILHALAPSLGWDFVRDAARWTYDEARHMLMGQRRLDAWGVPRSNVPLGGYIYEACAGEDALIRMGMLGYFETKNIGRKRERAQAFEAMGDRTSQVDMEFDWADETIHAEYGRRWVKKALELRGEDPESWPALLARCEELVERRVARATPDEKERIRECADALVREAERISSAKTRP
jgi:Protein of unknown function (DUF455)